MIYNNGSFPFVPPVRYAPPPPVSEHMPLHSSKNMARASGGGGGHRRKKSITTHSLSLRAIKPLGAVKQLDATLSNPNLVSRNSAGLNRHLMATSFVNQMQRDQSVEYAVPRLPEDLMDYQLPNIIENEYVTNRSIASITILDD